MPTFADVFDHLVMSQFDTRRDFLPEGYIERYMNRDTIREGIFPEKDVLDEADEDLITFINTDAKKVFATAYYVLITEHAQLLTSMRFFKSCGFNDSCLPIEAIRKTNGERNAPQVFPFPFNDIRDEQVGRVWHRVRIHNFLRDQWLFLAPVFFGKDFHLVLPPDCILPFTRVNRIVKEGRFSHVYDVVIHEHHRPTIIVSQQSVSRKIAHLTN